MRRIMTSVGNEISNFERLPPRAVGYILDHLNNLKELKE